MSDRIALVREIAARTKPRFIEIPREKRKVVPSTEEQLTEMRGGLTAEEYRWKLVGKKSPQDYLHHITERLLPSGGQGVQSPGRCALDTSLNICGLAHVALPKLLPKI
jgi:hypothetical protein